MEQSLQWFLYHIRLQVQGEFVDEGSKKYRGMLHGLMKIATEESFPGLYKGFLPALIREGFYSSFRMGCYGPLKSLLGEDPVKGGLPLWKKMIAGSIAGGIGAAIATPTDVVKVQLQAEGKVDVPRYTSTYNAFSTIGRKEGIKGLYRGLIPTTQRACILSAAMLPSYDHTKHFLLDNQWMKRDDIYVHIIAGMTAGFTMAVVTSPVDVIKTRVMNQKLILRDNVMQMPYKGSLDCLYKTVRREGPQALYKGFVPNAMRLGPHTLLGMIVYEQLLKLFNMKPM